MNFGWYPEQWSMGTGSFYATSSPSAFQLHGDLLPILVITNSGYQLNLSGQSLAGMDLAGQSIRRDRRRRHAGRKQ